MSQVEQLIRKALSTTSDDEAVACLKQARKRYSGQTMDIDVGAEKSTDYEELARKYHSIAYRNQQEVQRLRSQLSSIMDVSTHYMNRYVEIQKKLTKVEIQSINKDRTNALLKTAIAVLATFLVLIIVI
jgi:hypothetical protein